MFQANLWCYLWDLVDEGIEDVLDRLKGEVGVTGVSIATCYPSIAQLRPHAGVVPRVFRSAGGVQFQPQPSLYERTRVRPSAAAWLKKSNPLAAVAKACENSGLTLRGWVVGCHNPVAVARHGNDATKNVLGDRNPAWLCPANPDVREYLRSLVEDLSQNYPFETIELDQVGFPSAPCGTATLQTGLNLGATGTWLNDLCFCESCRQSATRDGIDVEAAAQSVQTTLDRILATGKPLDVLVEEFAAGELALETYVEWRCQQVASLIQMIKHTCARTSHCRLVVHRKGTRLREATDYAAITQHGDALLTPCDDCDVVAMENQIQSTLRDTKDINKVELGLTACAPICPDSESLVRVMSAAVRAGVRRMNVANYGLLPEARLEWVRQAIRYAQREAR